MVGNSKRGFVLQRRDQHLFRELALMRVIDREQTKLVAGFGSTTRANSRLLSLTRAGFLRRSFVGTAAGGMKAIYALTPRAAKVLEVPYRGVRLAQDEILIADFFVAHQLAVNDIYCALKYQPIPIAETTFHRWLSFNEALAPNISLIPDGYCELLSPSRIVSAFLEIDLGNEGRKVWQSKVQRYLGYATSGAFEKRFNHHQFRVLVIANSETKMKMIRTVTADLTEKIFWFSSLELIRQRGFWSSIWLRPKGDEQQTLL